MDVLLPIGGHLFSVDALKRAAADAAAEHPGKNNVLKGTVDADGANVVLAMKSEDGHWTMQAAFSHDWQGKNTFGVGGSYAW